MKKTGTLVLEGTTYDVELTARPAYTPDSSDTDVRTRRPRMSFPKYVKQGNKRRLNSVFMMENPRSIDPTKGLYSVGLHHQRRHSQRHYQPGGQHD